MALTQPLEIRRGTNAAVWRRCSVCRKMTLFPALERTRDRLGRCPVCIASQATSSAARRPSREPPEIYLG